MSGLVLNAGKQVSVSALKKERERLLKEAVMSLPPSPLFISEFLSSSPSSHPQPLAVGKQPLPPRRTRTEGQCSAGARTPAAACVTTRAPAPPVQLACPSVPAAAAAAAAGGPVTAAAVPGRPWGSRGGHWLRGP